eukprot:4525794-Pleurochrysis_carterae.AAC.1
MRVADEQHEPSQRQLTEQLHRLPPVDSRLVIGPQEPGGSREHAWLMRAHRLLAQDQQKRVHQRNAGRPQRNQRKRPGVKSLVPARVAVKRVVVVQVVIACLALRATIFKRVFLVDKVIEFKLVAEKALEDASRHAGHEDEGDHQGQWNRLPRSELEHPRSCGGDCLAERRFRNVGGCAGESGRGLDGAPPAAGLAQQIDAVDQQNDGPRQKG